MRKHSYNFKNLTGKRFGRLLVIKEIGKSKEGKILWKCKCDCGKKKNIRSTHLIQKLIKSCGCLWKELSDSGKLRETHKMRKTRFYYIYCGIKQRCKDINYKAFQYYGGRGIKCLWQSFEQFRDDMYESYLEHSKKFGEKQTTIDRINVNGNYHKQNCRWATHKEQMRNTKKTIFITFNKKIKSLPEWAEIFNIPRDLLYRRIRRDKWSIEKALNIPVRK